MLAATGEEETACLDRHSSGQPRSRPASILSPIKHCKSKKQASNPKEGRKKEEGITILDGFCLGAPDKNAKQLLKFLLSPLSLSISLSLSLSLRR